MTETIPLTPSLPHHICPQAAYPEVQEELHAELVAAGIASAGVSRVGFCPECKEQGKDAFSSKCSLLPLHLMVTRCQQGSSLVRRGDVLKFFMVVMNHSDQSQARIRLIKAPIVLCLSAADSSSMLVALNTVPLCCVCLSAADGSSPGRDFEPSDLGRLPLLSAVIKESLRVCPPAPFGGSRMCPVDDTDMCGYKVDKVRGGGGGKGRGWKGARGKG
jgi:hypothetical protein